MTGYTASGLPFPSPEDAANTVADQVRALAEAVEAMSGGTTVAATAATVTGVALRGNAGDNVVRYRRQGKVLLLDAKLTLGGTPTGTITLYLPGGLQAHGVTVTTAGSLPISPTRVVGTVAGLRQNIGWRYGHVILVGADRVQFANADGTFWGPGNPHAWAAADEIGVTMRVELA